MEHYKMGLSDYEFIKILGKGTYGEVIQYKKNGTMYAIKKIERMTNPEEQLSNLSSLNELSTMKRFEHPNLIRCIDFFVDKTYLYLVLPLYVSDLKSTFLNWEFSKKEKIRMIHQLASAIFCLHENGYYHCDLKEENILVDEKFNLILSDYSFVYPNQVKVGHCTTPKNSTPQFLYHWLAFSEGEKHKEDLILKNSLEKNFRNIIQQPGDKIKADIWCLCNLFTAILSNGKMLIDYTRYIDFLKNKDKMIDSFLKTLGFIQGSEGKALKKLIINMTEPDLRKFKITIHEVFDSEFFKINEISKPIPGTCVHFTKYSIPKKLIPEIQECIDWALFFYQVLSNALQNPKIDALFHIMDIIYRTYPSITLKNKRKNSSLIAYVALSMARIILYQEPDLYYPVLEQLVNEIPSLFDQKMVFDISVYENIEFQMLKILNGIPIMNTLFQVSKTETEIDKALCAMIHTEFYESFLRNSKLMSENQLNRYLPLNQTQINSRYFEMLNRLKKIK